MKFLPTKLPPADESCFYVYRCRSFVPLPTLSRCRVVTDEPPWLKMGTWYQFAWLRLTFNLYIADPVR